MVDLVAPISLAPQTTSQTQRPVRNLADAAQIEPSQRDGAMWAAAQALEASFLALMLEDAGVGAVPTDFGGSEGEAHFASFLREAQAQGMVQAGGIGLAESLFDAMKGRSDV